MQYCISFRYISVIRHLYSVWSDHPDKSSTYASDAIYVPFMKHLVRPVPLVYEIFQITHFF